MEKIKMQCLNSLILLFFYISVSNTQELTMPNNISPESSLDSAYIRRFNHFDWELLKAVSKSQENVFISSAGIKIILTMLLEGAKGKSAEEIANALRIRDINNPSIRRVLKTLVFDLNDKSANTLLESSNSVFVSKNYDVRPEYGQKLEDYKASIHKLDFYNSQNAVNYINSWIYNATHHLIRDVVNPASITPITEIVFVNALYFKSKWEYAFDAKLTKTKCFQSLSGCIDVSMMQIQESFNYNYDPLLEADVVDIPYQDNKYSMLLLIPAGANNVDILANDIHYEKFEDVLQRLEPTELLLEMPKFELELTTDLKNVLSDFKINEIFGNRANLSGILANMNVKVSDIVQKARIEVNEQGTKASAASVVVVVPLMGASLKQVSANRPFMFVIYHRQSKNIIFEGILRKPQSETPSFERSSPRRNRVNQPLLTRYSSSV